MFFIHIFAGCSGQDNVSAWYRSLCAPLHRRGENYVSVFSINVYHVFIVQYMKSQKSTRNTQAITGDLYKDDAIHENLKVSTVLIINGRQFT